MSEASPYASEHDDPDTEIIWNDVSDRIERFVQAWSANEVPSLVDFLPPAVAPSRPFTLIELIKVDIEQRWRGGIEPKSISDYRDEFPEIEGSDGIPVDLIYEELHLRQTLDPKFQLEVYLAAFPTQATELRRMLAVSDEEATTCVGRFAAKIDLVAGQRIDEFDLLALLGKGAFASVFLARQRSMQRIVAVKISADRGVEPQTLAKLDHPNIVRIYDQRLVPERGLRLLYMQYVPGGTLRDMLDILRRQSPLEKWTGRSLLAAIDQRLESQAIPPQHDSVNRRRLVSLPWDQAVCHLALQVAEALYYAHSQGVLHRDVKPANILISDSASPKLVDFNISSCSKVEGASATAYFGGSLAYMSPEQMEACSPRHDLTADSLGPPSDIYALGVVIWEMLLGSRPFADEPPQNGWTNTLESLITQRRQGITDERWQRLADVVSPGLLALLRKCLDPDPAQRFQTAAELADQLLICLHPKAQKLLAPPRNAWQKFMFRWPEVSIVLLTVLPNLFAAWMNYRFNYHTMIEPLMNAGAAFKTTMLVINAVGFPLGIAIGLWMCRKETAEVRRRAREGADEPAPRALRHRCLRLGRYVALVGIAIWTVAGICYPLAMRWAGYPLRGGDIVQFFFSLVGGGVIGASYPYFGVTTMITEVWYPALVRPRSVSTTDIAQFRWVERISARYLVMAAAVPLLSLGVLALSGQTDNPRILAGLSIGGLFLFGVVFLLWLRLQQNFRVLTELARAKAPAQIQLESVHSDELRL